MKHDQLDVQERPLEKTRPREPAPTNPWVFRLLLIVIAICVLGLIAKVFGF